MLFPSVQEQLDIISKKSVEIISIRELEKKLRHSIESRLPLKIKLGADPSRPDLHIGHSVVLRKLREFQDLGHEAILIIGDFTGMIGDPSGKSKTRPQLTAERVRENGKSYFEQASKILDAKKTTILYNSDWLGHMKFADVMRLSSHYTVARMLERDDFERRYRSNEPIAIHEFLYPLAQAMDSVHLKNDVELGGTDQKFNLLVGRDLQREHGITPQICITMPLLVGTDGEEKMSKSLGNAICLNDPPHEMYGKVLSIPDSLIGTYYSANTDVEISQKEIENNPRKMKRSLAREIVTQYYSADAAREAEEHFDRVFVQKKAPENIVLTEFDETSLPLVELLIRLGAASSKSEARRMIQQRAVTIGEEKITDTNALVKLEETTKILKAGKRKFYRIGGKKSF